MIIFTDEDMGNVYMVEFCRVQGIKYGDKFSGMEFIIWIHEKHSEFRKLTGWGDQPGDPKYQDEFTAWLKTKEAIK